MVKLSIESEPDLILSNKVLHEHKAIWFKDDYTITKAFKTEEELIKKYGQIFNQKQDFII